MNKRDILNISLVMYLLCSASMYFLGYKEIAYLLLLLLIFIVIALLVFDNIKFQYRLLDKKAIICADISNSKLLKLYYGNDRKIINDVYDVILENIENGFVLRKYTDHFVILVPYNNKNELVSLVNRINDGVKNIIEDDMFNLSLKFGIQLCDNEGFDSNENKAALACASAKKQALKSYCFYEEEDSLNTLEEKKILDGLIKSLKNNEFEVYYQPKYDYKQNKIVGSEALIRLVRDGVVIPAVEFIDISEKYGFTALLDKYVLKEVCKKIKELKKNKIEFKVISINVSRTTLGEKSMIDYYSNVLEQYGVKKDEIEIEVTERDTTASTYSLTDTIHELCKKFNVSVDDFGIGSSSLSMLIEKKIKTIKIDRKFIIDKSESGRKLLSDIIKLIKDLGFDIVAEGVDTKEQVDFLKKKGCNVIQGYYYSKPLTFEDYKKLLKGEE